MERQVVGAIAAVLVIMPHVGAAQVRSSEATVLTVRTYNNFGVSPEDLHAAQQEAAAVLRAVGIEIVWLDCWFGRREPAEAPRQCGQPREEGEIVLRLQSGNRNSSDRFVSMGFSLVGGAEPPYLSTVFPDVVQSVARGAASDARRVLGLAIAHEMGHLLLNINQHAHSGLMRADWSRTELRQHDASNWRFLGTEDIVIREAAFHRVCRC